MAFGDILTNPLVTAGLERLFPGIGGIASQGIGQLLGGQPTSANLFSQPDPVTQEERLLDLFGQTPAADVLARLRQPTQRVPLRGIEPLNRTFPGLPTGGGGFF